MNSLKAVVWVSIQPSLSLNTGGVQVTSTWYLGDEFENTHSYDIVSFCWPLVLAFSKQAIEYEFDFDLFSSVVVNQVFPPSRDNICIPFLEFATSKMKSVVSMPIVFVNKSQTPVRTILFNSLLS